MKRPALAPVPPPEPEDTRWRTTTVRLAPTAYRRLRRFAAGQEERTGERMTHQSIIETALDEYLTKNGGD